MQIPERIIGVYHWRGVVEFAIIREGMISSSFANTREERMLLLFTIRKEHRRGKEHWLSITLELYSFDVTLI